jgi:para-nitrobenzyl esterase
MRKLYLAILPVLMLLARGAGAQCPTGRYTDFIFPTVSKTTVTYSTVYSQQMDIYQPVGDTLSARPIIILGHGGSFLTGNGDRTNDGTIDSLCVRFAKRGYVTVSIDYRTTDIFSMIDSALAIDEVIKAISDGKAAIRYFVKDRATTNTYKIDTNNIYVGGNSAGAVLYMHVTYLDSIGECPSYIAAAMAANGGFEGNSGNDGYTTRFKAVINLAGGLNKSTFVGPGDKPSVNCQGTNDAVVPYNCAYPNVGLTIPVNLCGLGVLEGMYVSSGINHMSHIFPGDGHVPWASSAPKFKTVDSLVTIFLYNLVCNDLTSVNQVNVNTAVEIFPNPAHEFVNVQSPQDVSEIVLYDQMGRTVIETKGINKQNYEINTSRLNKGVYFVRIRFSNADNAPVVKRVVVD